MSSLLREFAYELYGSFMDKIDGGWQCSHCEVPVDIMHWTTTKHAPDCVINKALAVINNAALATPAASGWIPVSERLPKPFEIVLALGPIGFNPPSVFSAWMQPDQGGVPIHWMMFTWVTLHDHQVTHWMPLPAAPTERGGD